MSPAVIRWPLTAKARLGSGGIGNVRFEEVKLALRRWFSLSISVFPVSVIPPMLHTHLHLDTTLTRKTKGGRLVPRNIRCSLEYLAALERREASHYSLLHKYLTVLFEVRSPCDSKIIAEIYSKGTSSKFYVLLNVHLCIIL
jgi:hypothetical protein